MHAHTYGASPCAHPKPGDRAPAGRRRAARCPGARHWHGWTLGSRQGGRSLPIQWPGSGLCQGPHSYLCSAGAPGAQRQGPGRAGAAAGRLLCLLGVRPPRRRGVQGPTRDKAPFSTELHTRPRAARGPGVIPQPGLGGDDKPSWAPAPILSPCRTQASGVQSPASPHSPSPDGENPGVRVPSPTFSASPGVRGGSPRPQWRGRIRLGPPPPLCWGGRVRGNRGPFVRPRQLCLV